MQLELWQVYKKKSDPISVLHVAVGVLVRMCTGTCTVVARNSVKFGRNPRAGNNV